MNELAGGRLWLARAGWVAATLAGLGVYAASVPARYLQLLAVAASNGRVLAEVGLRRATLADAITDLDLVMMLACTAIALFIFWRKSDDWMAMLVSGVLVYYGIAVTRPVEAILTVDASLRFPIDLARGLGQGGALLFAYVFPDGRFIPRWTRWLAALFGVWLVAWLAWPTGPLNPDSLPKAVALTVLGGWLTTGLYARIYRYGRVSTAAQRQQTKWVTFGVIVALAGFLLFSLAPLVYAPFREPGIARLVYVTAGVPLLYMAMLMLPLSIAFSILRYHLWDVDILIRRTLVYAVLSGALALVYLGLVVSLLAPLRALTGQTDSEVVTVASTLAVAALFVPLRRRVQGWIDRRFYRRRYDITQTLATFGESIRDDVDLDRLAAHLVSVVEETMHPARVSLWLRTHEEE